MTDARPVVITLTIVTAVPEQVHRTIDALARAAAGLALEGVYLEITTSTVEDEDEDDET